MTVAGPPPTTRVTSPPPVVAAVGAVVRRGDDLLLVRRARPPAAGAWSLPGGRIRFGEDAIEAVVREVAEETGLAVTVERFVGWAQRIHPESRPPEHFVILDFAATPLHPEREPVPGDDALEAAWVPATALADRDLVPGLLEFLTETGVLPLPPERP